MAQTPESRAIALLEAEATIHRRYQEDVEASEQLHAARTVRAAQDRDAGLAHLATVALELLSHALKLDERAPEPVKAPRKPRGPRTPKPDATLMSAENVEKVLSLTVPDLAAEAKGIHPNALRQLLTAAKARGLVAHVATLEREIGGRS